MQKIVTFLTFDREAEEAASLYVSVFKNSRILNISRYSTDGPLPEGTAMGVSFVLEGQEFYALNGGPYFSFSNGISLFVNCETQEEVDTLWEKLSEGGEKEQCGWLKDRFGVSWQVVPTVLGEMLGDSDQKKAASVMQAMMRMTKLDIDELKRAYEQA